MCSIPHKSFVVVHHVELGEIQQLSSCDVKENHFGSYHRHLGSDSHLPGPVFARAYLCMTVLSEQQATPEKPDVIQHLNGESGS